MGANTQNLIVTHKNYYQILGVEIDATPKDVSKTFKKLALKWHPDRHSEFQKSFAHRKFLEIMEAYEVLGHPARRRKYDAYRAHRRKRPRATTYTNTSSKAFKKSDFKNQRTRAEATNRPKRNASDSGQNSQKFEKEMRKWKKAAEKHARKLAKKSYMSFAGTLESVSKLVIKGVFSTIDIISGKSELNKTLKPHEKNIESSPDDGESHYQMGFIYHKKGVYEEALKYYLQAIKLTPNNADLFCNLGRLREEQSEYNRAISCYERAVELEPHYAPVYTYMGMLHLKMNNFVKAKSCMDILHSMNRSDLAKQIERAYKV